MSKQRICIFGEVLFDHFPDGTRVLGGAPFNVAWHLQAFGQSPRFISRVGADSAGNAIRNAMQAWGMDTSGLQTDPERATGRVEVSLVDGEPAYDIVHPCAYDAIEADPGQAGCDVLYHGSLALRDELSRETVAQLVRDQPQTVFVDVNLRSPWWRKEQVLGLLHDATWVKLNTDELQLLHTAGGDRAHCAPDFLKHYGLQGLLLTHGAQGAELLTAAGEDFRVTPGRNIEVVDTVGAGDAFTAVMLLGLVSDWPALRTLQRAQDFASAIVGNRGATVSDPTFYQSFIQQWRPGA